MDSDPANKYNRATTWDLADRWVDPGLLEKFLIISAFPAFVVGGFAVGGLGRLGISQVLSFMTGFVGGRRRGRLVLAELIGQVLEAKLPVMRHYWPIT